MENPLPGLERLVRDTDEILTDALDQCFEQDGDEGLAVLFGLMLNRLVHHLGGDDAAVDRITETARTFSGVALN